MSIVHDPGKRTAGNPPAATFAALKRPLGGGAEAGPSARVTRKQILMIPLSLVALLMLSYVTWQVAAAIGLAGLMFLYGLP